MAAQSLGSFTPAQRVGQYSPVQPEPWDTPLQPVRAGPGELSEVIVVVGLCDAKRQLKLFNPMTIRVCGHGSICCSTLLYSLLYRSIATLPLAHWGCSSTWLVFTPGTWFF